MMTCKEVSTAVASEDLARLSWGRRIGIHLHLLMCRHCRRYAAQLAAIGNAARRLYRAEPPTKSLEESILNSLKKK
jgi:anti-sigma factor ChrR (cupin superfamily)